MEEQKNIYDIAIIGLGPAGSTLARLLSTDLKVIGFDKKQQVGEDGFQKPCGGLLAPDAQRSFIRSNLTLPTDILSDPQIFSVKTMDLQSDLIRYYQRTYVNFNRHAFDLWLKSIIPSHVDVRHDTLCRQIEKQDQLWKITFQQNDEMHVIYAQKVVGADGANSILRRKLYPNNDIRKYISIQEWFKDEHSRPFYSCIFDNNITDCYSWSISKNGHFIFGGAFPMKNADKSYQLLKQKMSDRGFIFNQFVKREKCTVFYPSRWKDFVCGKDNAFLIGEAAGFISASSLEGISYAQDSAEVLSEIFNEGLENPHNVYQKRTFKIRLKLLTKVIKARLLVTPILRKLIMKSGLSSIKVKDKSL